MRQTAIKLILIMATVLLLSIISWIELTRNPNALTLKELGENAGKSYIYGFPLVLMDETRSAMITRRDGFAINTLSHIPSLPNHELRYVVRPNRDTLYSIAWLDLSTGPVILSWPDMGDRYWLFQVLDGWTDVIGQPGSRLKGNAPGSIMIAGPHWDGMPPPDVQLIQSQTNMAWVLGRIAVTETDDDLQAGRALQADFDLTSRSETDFMPRPDSDLRPPTTVSQLEADIFFERLASLMVKNPARKTDSAMLSRLETIGVESGQFNQQGFGLLARKAIDKGVELARVRMAEVVLNRVPGPNGWVVPSEHLGNYRTDYNLRAGVALLGLGANRPEDAIYPMALADDLGRPLNGDFTYQLRFKAGQLPPAEAFWSITSYDSQGWLMDVPRYNLGDRSDLIFETDGALVITVGPQLPAQTHAQNHLPVLAGEEFQLTARLYDPSESAVTGQWAMPVLTRMD